MLTSCTRERMLYVWIVIIVGVGVLVDKTSEGTCIIVFVPLCNMGVALGVGVSSIPIGVGGVVMIADLTTGF